MRKLQESDLKSPFVEESVFHKFSIDGIPEKFLPEIKIEADRLRIYFSDEVEIYVGRMKEIMVEIKNVERGGETGRLLSLLSYYLRLGVSAHPFKRINFSLLMGQVNYILEFHGLKGISHRNLDYLALIMNSDAYEKVFVKHVKEVNPDI